MFIPQTKIKQITLMTIEVRVKDKNLIKDKSLQINLHYIPVKLVLKHFGHFR